MMTGKADPVYFGADCAETWDLGLRRFIVFRDHVGEERFYDIGFDEVQAGRSGRSPVCTNGWARISHRRRSR